jgi:hypothetical protein
MTHGRVPTGLWTPASNEARLPAVTDDELVDALDAAFSALEQLADRDWTLVAGSLDWTCWQTIDHTIDCVHSFALQIGSEANTGFLPFAPMHAEVAATPSDLIQGLRGVSVLLTAIARESPQDRSASDGIVSLNIADWRARTAYEVVLHTYDVVTGLSGTFSLSDELAASIIRSEALWMLGPYVVWPTDFHAVLSEAALSDAKPRPRAIPNRPPPWRRSLRPSRTTRGRV